MELTEEELKNVQAGYNVPREENNNSYYPKKKKLEIMKEQLKAIKKAKKDELTTKELEKVDKDELTMEELEKVQAGMPNMK